MLRVSLRRSYCLSAVLAFAHCGAAATLIALDIVFEAKLAVAIAVAMSLVYSLWRYAFLSSLQSIVAIELKEGGSAAAQFRSGAWRDATVLGTTYVSPLLTVLNLRIDGHALARHALIVPDTLPTEDFRKLRVILRWHHVRNKAVHATGTTRVRATR